MGPGTDAASLRPFVLEETYEVLDAIEGGSPPHCGRARRLPVRGGLPRADQRRGRRFSIGDAIDAICDKLVRRHPHVFARQPATVARRAAGDREMGNAEGAGTRRRGSEPSRPKTTLSGVPKTLPALLRAYEISARAAAVGFDWARAADVLDKIDEEVAEVRHEVESGATGHLSRAEEEMGDLLFAIANLVAQAGDRARGRAAPGQRRSSRRSTRSNARSPHAAVR